MNKHGFAEMLEWIPRLMLMLIAIVVIAMLVRYYAARDIDSAALERNTYLYRLYYDDIIMYEDTVGRVYPGIIDLKKFNDAVLTDIFGVHGKISSSLTLLSSCVPPTPIYHDKTTYEQYIGFARFGTLGPGSATVQETLLPVTIKGAQTCTGMLNITIVRPNS